MIEILHLTYTAHGGAPIVSDLTCKVRNGQICGLLGSDAPVMSTVTRLVAGCLEPTAGQVLINGYDIQKKAKTAKRAVAYLPSPVPAPGDMTPFEYLSFIAELRCVDGDEIYRAVHEALVATNLVGVQDRLISTLSPITVRRLGLATILPGDPDTVILDAPMAGLNVKERGPLCAMIRKMCQGKTVLVTGAPTPELSGICHRILTVADGRISEMPATAPQSTEEENA